MPQNPSRCPVRSILGALNLLTGNVELINKIMISFWEIRILAVSRRFRLIRRALANLMDNKCRLIMNIIKFSKVVVVATLVSLVASSALAAETNKEKIRLFYDAFEKSDAALLDKVLAPNWEDVPLNPGQGPGLEGFKPFIPKYGKIFANMKMTNEDIIEEGNKIVVRSTFEGTNIGSFAGFPAKGRPVKIMTIDIHEFNKDGLVAKTWHVENWLGGLYQMGAFEK